MNRLNRIVSCFAMILLLFLMLPLQISANGPPPARWYDIYVTNLPMGTVYVDLLIPLSENDSAYTDLEKDNLPDTFSETAEIITYSEDGFCSYTFHYKDSLSVIKPRDKNMVSFFMTDAEGDASLHYRYGHMQDIEQRGCIRLAMLDKAGNILKVSTSLHLETKDIFASKSGDFYYDGTTDTWKINTRRSAFGVVVYVFMSIIGIVLTCLVEWLVSKLFRLSKQHRVLVLKTNMVSQVVMRLVFVLLYEIIFWKYRDVVILLELVVYAGEYLWYRKHMQTVAGNKVLLYTIIANTASLILGYRLNEMLLYSL